ncbi:DUF4426 domain-containing protein [Salinibius halmophilus]|uniref:DUF4426 domain-containing protein n=1 Tax=Salinibius halmophilus TaxID=1853216 RepID=UPI000E676129|nr:DUF4426 domain-containing protein [Salinibius halmophilus]
MQKIIIAALALCFSLSALAEQKVAIRGYDVHYMALSTAELTEDVAAAYGINRSNKQAFLSISVLKPQPDSIVAVPVEANVTGSFRNMIGQTRQLEFRQVKEGSAIYYLAEFRFLNEEILRFTLQVEPEGGASQTVEFQQSIWEAL